MRIIYLYSDLWPNISEVLSSQILIKVKHQLCSYATCYQTLFIGPKQLRHLWGNFIYWSNITPSLTNLPPDLPGWYFSPLLPQVWIRFCFFATQMFRFQSFSTPKFTFRKRNWYFFLCTKASQICDQGDVYLFHLFLGANSAK